MVNSIEKSLLRSSVLGEMDCVITVLDSLDTAQITVISPKVYDQILINLANYETHFRPETLLSLYYFKGTGNPFKIASAVRSLLSIAASFVSYHAIEQTLQQFIENENDDAIHVVMTYISVQHINAMSPAILAAGLEATMQRIKSA